MRRHAIVIGALLCGTSLSSPACSQAVFVGAPPPHYDLDANAVDRTSGNVLFTVPEISIGPAGPGGLVYINYHADYATGVNNTNWGLVLYQTGNVFQAVLPTGVSESFTYSGGTFVSASGDGSTLTGSGSSYTFTESNGTRIVYAFPTEATGEPVVIRATQIIYPRGETDNLAWEIASYTTTGTPQATNATSPSASASSSAGSNGSSTSASSVSSPAVGSGTTRTWVRLQSVVSSTGYQLHFNYTLNTIAAQSDGSKWAQISSINAINDTIDYCSPQAITCTGLSQTPATVSYAYPSATSVQVTDPVGRVTTYTRSPGSFTVQLPGSSSPDYSYTFSGTTGLPTQVVRDGATYAYASSIANGLLTINETDPLGDANTTTADTTLYVVKSHVDSPQSGVTRTTNFGYSSGGLLTSVVYPEGNQVQYGYDARGNVTTTTYVAKPGSGLANITTSAIFPSTCTSALTCNQPTSTTDARGNVTSYTYDPNSGGVATVTSPAVNNVAPQTRYIYSALQAYYKNSAGSIVASGSPVYELTSTSTCRTTASCSGGANEIKTTIAYGTAGVANNLLPTSVTGGAGDGSLTATSSVGYDAAGDIVAQTDPLGNMTNYIYDAARQLNIYASPDPDGAGPLNRRDTLYHYTPLGKVDTISQGYSGPNGFVYLQNRKLTYDAAGRPLTDSILSGDNSTTYSLVQYSYDAAGRLDCTAVRMNTSAFGSLPATCSLGTQGSYGPDRISRNSYDAASQLLSVTDGYGTSLQRTTVTYTYTPDGKVHTLADAKNNQTTYAYDGFDRLLTTTYPNAAGGDYEQLGYDANGNVTSRRLRDGSSVGFVYDALNRLTQRSSPHLSSGGDPTLTFSYDLVGHMTGAADENNHLLSFGYDVLGRKTSEASVFSNATMTYDLAGRRTQLKWSDGFYVTYGYDNVGEMTAINENGSAALVGFAYDDLGRRTSRSFANGTSTTYAYDGASRLTSLALSGTYYPNTITLGGYSPADEIGTHSNSNDAFAYTGQVNSNTAFTTNTLNQYTAISGVAQAYDGRGNLTTSGSRSYAYNSRNELVSGTGIGGYGYYYDPMGRLDTNGPESVWFGYDDDRLITEVNYSGQTIARRYVFGPGTDEPLVWYEGSGTGSKHYMDADERGSIVRITDGSGNALNNLSYDEYGVPATTNPGRFQYTGQAWLPAAGMYDYKARMYSPTLGRFMQTDPIGYGDGPNWYNYVGGNPVRGGDPSGLAGGSDDYPNKHWIDPPPPPTGTRIPGGISPSLFSFLGYGAASSSSGGGSDGTAASSDATGDGSTPQNMDAAAAATGSCSSCMSGPNEAETPPDNSLGQDAILVVAPEEDAAGVVGEEIVVTASREGWFARFIDSIFGRSACFAAGTLVQTDHGLRAIETIKPGDMVLSRDEKTGATTYRRVTAVKMPTMDELYIVDLDVPEGAEAEHHADFEATATHPWRSLDSRWVPTLQLRRGMKLVRSDGLPAQVESVHDTGHKALTYNLTVEGYHTYFVGKDHVWVHNACPPGLRDATRGELSNAAARDGYNSVEEWKTNGLGLNSRYNIGVDKAGNLHSYPLRGGETENLGINIYGPQ